MCFAPLNCPAASGRVRGQSENDPYQQSARSRGPGGVWEHETLVLQVRSLGFVFRAVADCYQENGALSFGVRREETGHVVIEEGETRGAQPLGVCFKIAPATENARFELHGAISS